MFSYSRLTELFKSSKEILFDDSSKFIFFGDCHRGVNTWGDNFAENRNIFFHSLNYYYKNGFSYIEMGDGDELWDNKSFSNIRIAHSDVFKLMAKFYKEKRLYVLYGNHDKERENADKVKETLYRYYSEHKEDYEPLFDGIEIYEGLVLKNAVTGSKIFLIHGHQVDIINSKFWRLGRFLSRYFWRYLKLLGIKDPTSPAFNVNNRIKVEERLKKWVMVNNQALIAGHTHRPIFPSKEDLQYFNPGSCVHPRCITGLELQHNTITLVKWSVSTKDDGLLYVVRDVLAGPREL
jgi:predicted phosphodiesterase